MPLILTGDFNSSPPSEDTSTGAPSPPGLAASLSSSSVYEELARGGGQGGGALGLLLSAYAAVSDREPQATNVNPDPGGFVGAL